MEHDATVSEVRRGCTPECGSLLEVRVSGGYLMADDPYDHGMKEHPCPVCAGRGQVVVPKAVARDDGSVDTWEVADICPICGGDGKVWL